MSFWIVYTLEISSNWHDVVQAAGFEPAKHYAADLEPAPFDHSGTPAPSGGRYPT